MPDLFEQELAAGSMFFSVWATMLVFVGLGAWLHALVHRKWLVAVKGPPPEWKPPLADFALLGIALLLALVIVGPLIAVEIIRLLPGHPEELSEWAFLLQSLSMQGTILLTLGLFWKFQPKTFETVGGKPSRGLFYAAKWGAYGFVLAIPLVALANIVTIFLFNHFGWEFSLQETVEEIVSVESTLLFLLMPLPVVILAPLWEEIVFRGGLFRYLKNCLPGSLALLLSAICFSLIHGQPAQFGGILILGLILALVYQKSGSLLAPILMHAFFNANTLLGLFFLRFL
ncbi:MAG: CPBP family intramembrane metalloprotease [Opitutales bacterium]|nr:CPBP family intramembrane metalloprotease [Opitutales bacterium]MCH8540924.1 CPBP family intramembrane metalloprotease [Opitutales bacterium]